MEIYKKVTLWYAISAFGIFGPFVSEKNGLTVTVTSQHVLHNLEQLRTASVD